jgi:acetyl-CoA acyltransferase
MASRALVIDSVRTGMCKAHRGSFNLTRPDTQLAHCITRLVERVGIDRTAISDVVTGCAFPEGPQGQNVSRIASMLAGLPASTAAVTVNRFCSSGSQAIALAAVQIMVEGIDVAIGAGVESITMIRDGNYNSARLKNSVVAERFPGLYMSMGKTAENVARRYDVSRATQDQWGLVSQQRYAAAHAAGRFDDEIVPLEVERRLGSSDDSPVERHLVDRDECGRAETTLSGLASLAPAFEENGSVTAGNSSQLTDGASATLLASERFAADHELVPLGAYMGSAAVGCQPDEMGIGPIYAVPLLLERFGLTMKDIGLVELNEAFASQVVAVARELSIPEEKLNVDGGAIAIGHPFGMTGSRLTGHLLRSLRDRGSRYGIVTMCVGGGMGFASLFDAEPWEASTAHS